MFYCTHCGKELVEGAQFCPSCGAPVQSAAVTPTSSTTGTLPSPSRKLGGGLVLATWGERFIAWLIDIIIIGAIVEVLRFPGLSTPFIPFSAFGSREVILFIYWTLMEGAYGQSIGKMVMRLKVTELDGSSPTYTETAIGSIGKAFLLPLDCIIGWLAYSCKEKKQRLFSMLAKTMVIKA